MADVIPVSLWSGSGAQPVKKITLQMLFCKMPSRQSFLEGFVLPPL